MKKIFFSIVAALLCLPLLNSCGGGSGSDKVVDEAIAQAVEQVPLADSELFGQIPSLQMQYLAAKKAMDEAFSLESEAMAQKIANTKDVEEAKNLTKEYEERRDTAEAQLSAYYESKVAEAVPALEGKELPATFDESQYSAVKLVLQKNEEGDFLFPLKVDVQVTLAAPYKSVAPTVDWVFQDEAGSEIQPGAKYLDRKPYKEGDVISITISLPQGEELSKVANVHFKKS